MYLWSLYDKCYPRDGYDPIAKTLNGVREVRVLCSAKIIPDETNDIEKLADNELINEPPVVEKQASASSASNARVIEKSTDERQAFTEKWLVLFTEFFKPSTCPAPGHELILIKIKKYEDDHYANTITRILTFFGFPTRITRPALEEKLTFLKVLKNFVGWPDTDAPSFQRKIFWLRWLPVLLLNVTAIPLKFAFNCAKLLTEFFPTVLIALCEDASKHFGEKEQLITINANLALKAAGQLPGNFDKLTLAKKNCLKLLINLINLVKNIGHCYLFLGRAITSPLNNLRYARKFKFNKNNIPEEFFIKEMNWVIRALLIFLSLAVTILFYSLCWPLALKVIIAHAPIFAGYVAIAAAKIVGGINHIPLLNHAFGVLFSGVNTLIAGTILITDVSMSVSVTLLAAVSFAGVIIATVVENIRKRAADHWYCQDVMTGKAVIKSVSSSSVENLPINHATLSNQTRVTLTNSKQVDEDSPKYCFSLLAMLRFKFSKPAENKVIVLDTTKAGNYNQPTGLAKDQAEKLAELRRQRSYDSPTV